MNETFPVLYILLRNDMDSMNAGKGAAQASHASNAFWKQMNDSFLESEGQPNTPAQDLANEWQLSTNQGFGTVLVLAVNEVQMNAAVSVAESMGFVSGIVHDPTYPLRDGDVTHFLPINTCGFVFGSKGDPMLAAILGQLPLHP